MRTKCIDDESKIGGEVLQGRLIYLEGLRALVDGHIGRDLGVQLDGHGADADVNRVKGGKAHLMDDPQILRQSHTIEMVCGGQGSTFETLDVVRGRDIQCSIKLVACFELVISTLSLAVDLVARYRWYAFLAVSMIRSVRRWWGKEEGRGFVIGGRLNKKKNMEHHLREERWEEL